MERYEGLGIKHGTITKYFNQKEKQFGFIRPDEAREDRKAVFFHRNNCNPTTESEILSKVDLNFESWVSDREPRVGDRVVYFETTTTPKGPKAWSWGYEDELQKGIALIKERANRYDPKARIVLPYRVDEEEATTVIWEGVSSEKEKVFLPNHYPHREVWFQILLAHGWTSEGYRVNESINA